MSRNLFKISLLFAFFVFGAAKHLKQQYDFGAEVELNHIYKAYKQDIDKLSEDITKLRQSLSGNSSNTTVKMSRIQDALANQRDTLYGMGVSLSIPFNYSLCDCQSLTDQQRAIYQSQANAIGQSLSILEQNIKANQCSKISRLINQQKQQLADAQKILNSECCKKGKVIKQADFQPVGIVDLTKHKQGTKEQSAVSIQGVYGKIEAIFAIGSQEENPLNTAKTIDKSCSENKISYTKNNIKKPVEFQVQPDEAQAQRTRISKTRKSRKMDKVVQPFEQDPQMFKTQTTIRKTQKDAIFDALSSNPTKTLLQTFRKSHPVSKVVEPLEAIPTKNLLQKKVSQIVKKEPVNAISTEPIRTVTERRRFRKIMAVKPKEIQPCKTTVIRQQSVVKKQSTVEPNFVQPNAITTTFTKSRTNRVETITPIESEPVKSVIERRKSMIKESQTRTLSAEESIPISKKSTASHTLQSSVEAPMISEPSKHILKTFSTQSKVSVVVEPVQAAPVSRTITQTRQVGQRVVVEPVTANPQKKVQQTRRERIEKTIQPLSAEPNRT